MGLVEVFKLCCRWVYADRNGAVWIKGEQGSIVASNIEDHIPVRNGTALEQFLNLALEVKNHRTVQTRAVAVIRSIHFGGIVGMRQLQQRASAFAVAFHNLQRAACDFLVAGPGEHAGKSLVPQ